MLQQYDPGLIAVSGGLDSRFLAFCARRVSPNYRAVFFAGPHMTDDETADALAWLGCSGLIFHIVEQDPLLVPGVADNTRERCYLCKQALFAAANKLARIMGLAHVLDGTNASDLDKFRPGLKALQEQNVKSPLAEAGLTKDDIRSAARHLGLDNPDQPSRPCLLTRFEYGLSLDRKVIKRLNRAENMLRSLNLLRFRLRILGDSTTKPRFLLQVDPLEKDKWLELEAKALAKLADLGFAPLEVSLETEVSGFFDRAK